MPNARRRFVAALVAALLFPLSAAAVQRRAFVTSVSGNGNLNSWPDSGGLFALAAGDAICRARAQAAGLPNASTYKVWLSTANTDAYCHVQGRTGKKANGCSGAPAPAGPWFRIDGTPFTGTLAELTGSERRIYTGVVQEEDGTALSGSDSAGYWTGTSETGAAVSETCASWVVGAADLTGRTGTALGSATSWSSEFSTACNQNRRLLCVEPGQSETGPGIPWNPAALVFVTSLTGTGNLASWGIGTATGIEAGDAICQQLAAEARLPAPESFVAWLSDSQVDARDRLTLEGIPYRRVDHRNVAASKAELLDIRNHDSIHVDETGQYIIGHNLVATGTLGGGTWEGSSCNDWTAALPQNVRAGFASRLRSGAWTAGAGVACSSGMRLYCFSNVVTLFWDGFDLTGDAGRWSLVVP